MAATRVEIVPESEYGGPKEHLRRAVQAINQLQNGQGNNHFQVTLRPNETSTEIIAVDVTAGSVATVVARSATAALDPVQWTEALQGKILLHHSSAPETDRLVGVVING